MTLTTHDSGINPQILTETVQAAFAQRNALMGSGIASQGAVVINGSFDVRDPKRIGKTVEVPYFGAIGDFTANSDGSSVTPSGLEETEESATVARYSLAFEITRWGQYGVAGDPYKEAVRQIMQSAERKMDAALIDSAVSGGNAIAVPKYSATTPDNLDWDMVVDAKAYWGDEQEDFIAMVVNSRTEADLLKLRDADGRPLLVDGMAANGGVMRFMGKPVVVSDKLPTTGSSMGTVVSAGTSPPDLTLAGTPTGAWDLRLKCTKGGALGTAEFEFSTDGGIHWSAAIVTSGTATALTDTAADSLVGFNGATGVTAAFASATFNTDNTWSATALLKARTLLLKRNALAFWYNKLALELLTHPDILADANIGAMHLYCAPHTYRRVPNGTKPGVIVIDHNVGNYIG